LVGQRDLAAGRSDEVTYGPCGRCWPNVIQSVLRLGYAGSGQDTRRRALADVLVPKNSTGA
jgi:hypothetical protein